MVEGGVSQTEVPSFLHLPVILDFHADRAKSYMHNRATLVPDSGESTLLPEDAIKEFWKKPLRNVALITKVHLPVRTAETNGHLWRFRFLTT